MRLLPTGIPEAGGTVTLNCTVSLTPYLTVSPTLEILGPGELLLASEETNTYLSYTIDPVMTWDAGLYICRANLKVYDNERRSLDLDEDSKSFVRGLSVQCKCFHGDDNFIIVVLGVTTINGCNSCTISNVQTLTKHFGR